MITLTSGLLNQSTECSSVWWQRSAEQCRINTLKWNVAEDKTVLDSVVYGRTNRGDAAQMWFMEEKTGATPQGCGLWKKQGSTLQRCGLWKNKQRSTPQGCGLWKKQGSALPSCGLTEEWRDLLANGIENDLLRPQLTTRTGFLYRKLAVDISGHLVVSHPVTGVASGRVLWWKHQ